MLIKRITTFILRALIAEQTFYSSQARHTANPIALQNEPVVEFDRTHNPLRDEALERQIHFE